MKQADILAHREAMANVSHASPAPGRRVTDDELLLAAVWLRTYEGDGDSHEEVTRELEAMEVIARRLENEVRERRIARIAREHGLSLANARKVLARAEASADEGGV